VEPSFNAWRLASLSPWPRWVLVLAALAAAGAVLLAWRGLRGESRPGRKAALLALRLAAATAALFLVAEPAVRLLQTARVKNRLAVLVSSNSGPSAIMFPMQPRSCPRFSSVTKPPWSRRIFLTIGRPSPVPVSLVVK